MGDLTLELDDGFAWATLNRPEKLNAMAPTFWGELRTVLDEVARNDDVRALVFRGAGRCFSVGGDIEGFGTLGDIGQRRAYAAEALGAFRAVEELPKPTIAAVHGFAYGGGCELTMVCDIVVADEAARFATPEANVGLMPGLAVVRGRAHSGLHALKYLALTGETIDAEQARLAGIVNTVTPAGGHEAEAERLARLIATKAPVALAAAKRLLSRGSDDGYGHAIETVALLQSTEDHAEGIAAFTARREPRFRGR